MDQFFSLLIGYAFGCFLTADVVCRRLAGKSVFQVGVGNPGMANVGHELGTRAAALVLAGDIAKTLAAWLVVRALFPANAAVCGLAATTGATIGHNFPAWHRFRGGKGVTTTCSAIILAAPALGIGSAVVGLVVVLLSGYLCVGAEAITLTFLLTCCVAYGSTSAYAAYALVLAALMLWAHWSALVAAAHGTQPRASISVKFWKRLRRTRR